MNIKEFIQHHLDHLHEVFAGRAKDSDGNAVEWADFHKGMQAAYTNMYSFVKNEEDLTNTEDASYNATKKIGW